MLRKPFGLVWYGRIKYAVGLLGVVVLGLAANGLTGPQAVKIAQAGPTTTIQAISSGFLGGNGSDHITGVAHAPDGSMIVVGNTTNPDFPLVNFPTKNTYGPVSQSDTGGFVARISSNGQSPLWLTYFSHSTASPNRVVVDSAGDVYIAGIAYNGFQTLNLGAGVCDTTVSNSFDPFVAKLSGGNGTLVWGSVTDGDSALNDVHIGLAGGNAPIISGRSGNRILLASFSNTGGCGFKTSFTDPLNNGAFSYINGLAVKASDSTSYAVGYHQRSGTLKVPFLIAFDGNGNPFWYNYNTTPVPGSLGADTEGQAVSLDPAGNLIAAFKTDGGNNVLMKDPKNLSSGDIPQLNGAYQNSHGRANGAAPSSFIGRYAAASGNILDATFFHSSLSDGKTNTTKIQTVRTDNANRVYFAGVTACCLPFTPDAVRQTYSSNEAFFGMLNAEMSSLVYATYMGKSGEYSDMSIGGGRVALGGSIDNLDFYLKSPLQPQLGGSDDGILAVFNPPYDLQLAFTTQPQIMGVGNSSGPITVQLRDTISGAVVAANTNYTLNLSSSGASGSFAYAPGGPFDKTTVTLASGASTATFYYRNTATGTPTITISGAGFNTLTQSHTIVKLSVSPPNLQFKANRLGNNLPDSQELKIRLDGAPSANWLVDSISYSGGGSGWLAITPNTGATPRSVAIGPNATLPASGPYTATVTLRESTYNTTASFGVSYLIKDPVLRVISSPQTISANATSGALVIELGDVDNATPIRNSGSPISINLSAAGGSGTFHASVGDLTAISSVQLQANKTRVSFYYRPSTLGTHNLNFAPVGYASLTQPLLVVNSAACAGFSPTQVNNGGDDNPTDPCQITLRKALAAGNTITLAPDLTNLTAILKSPLPALAGKTFNGGCPGSKPGLRIDGWSIETAAIGLQLSGTNALEGVAVYGFNGLGLQLAPNSTVTLDCTYFGTPDAVSAQPNGGSGLSVDPTNRRAIFNHNVVFWQRKLNS